ncbi:MAG: hypothetical protein NVS4B1_03560 [Ktedonobacteraceae bacterium]
MNCNQARSMLAAYRELKHGQVNTTELDVHLEQCAACRHVLAQHSVVGERVRLLPTLEAAPDAHTKLMHTLAAEHARFLQRSSNAYASSASSVPDFLKPYMNEQLQASGKNSDTLRAFSTAETGPLPIIQQRRKRRIAPMGQFAVLSLAASFLMIFLVGGLVSLLALANHGATGPGQIAAIKNPSLIAPVSYTAETSYSHIASAVATHEHIYYSAYGNDETQWMIEQVNGTAKNATSVPLLKSSSQSPLFVLGASSQWIIWLQFDAPQNKIQKHTTIPASTRSWSLNALPLVLSQDQHFGSTITLQHGTFDTTTVPDWIHTPIQGISFTQQDTLLVTSLDAKGTAQLVRYMLDSNSGTTSSLIAKTNNGHILTSPTATSDGTSMFWSEEWFTNDQQPHSIIWTQETTRQVARQKGAWRPSITLDKHIYRSDNTSFHPQVINDTLFWLSTSDTAVSTQATPSTPSTPAIQATAKPVSTAPVTSRFPDMYTSQIDEFIHGTVLAVPLDDPSTTPTTLSNNSTAAALQAGTRFLLWQSSTGYQMYDAFAKSPVEIKDSTKGATFLTVNADSAVWIVAANPSSTKNTKGTQLTTFNMFNWPA